MKSFVAMIRSALASLRRIVWKVVEVGGKAILTLVPGPAAAEPAPDFSDLAQVDDGPSPSARQSDRYERIRELARQIDVAPPAAIQAVGVATATWLAAMSPTMIAKVLVATDAELADHINGHRTIRGLLYYDKNSGSDYVRVTQRPSQSRTIDGMVHDAQGLSLAF